MGDVYEDVTAAVRSAESETDRGAPVTAVITRCCEDGSRPEDLVRLALSKLTARGTLAQPADGIYTINDGQVSE